MYGICDSNILATCTWYVRYFEQGDNRARAFLYLKHLKLGCHFF